MKKPTARFLCFVLSAILTALLLAARLPARAYGESWTDAPEMLLYYEAMTKIASRALDQPSRREVVQKSVNAYLQSIDPFSNYLTPEAYTAFKASMKGDFVGIGMEIEKNGAGKIICLPYPDQPAYGAGIRAGDILEKVEGVSVSGKSVFEVAAMTKGEEGTSVLLTIRSGMGGRQKDLRISRTSVHVKSVEVNRMEGIPVIRIKYFGTGTQRELKLALSGLDPSAPLVIDLRDNPGGDLNAGIDSAMLFLEKGKTIVTVEKTDESFPYMSLGNTVNAGSPLYLWQNRGTASAGEVFIAALTDNDRAVSVGERTYGKGTIQEIIPLSDSSAIFLTTGRLVIPNGEKYHGRGLAPTHPLGPSELGDADYLSRVKELMGGNKEKPNASAGEGRRDLQKSVSLRTVSKRETVEKAVPEIVVAVNPKQNYLICFKKRHAAKEEAEIWASVVRNSLSDAGRQFLMRTAGADGDGQGFMVCLGPYETARDARKRGDTVAHAMKEKVFVRQIAPGENDRIRKHRDASFPSNNDDREQWYIQILSSTHRDPMIDRFKSLSDVLRERGIDTVLQISTEKVNQETLLDRRYIEEQGIAAILVEEGDADLTRYKILVGPYVHKDDDLLQKLVKDGLIDAESFWVKPISMK